jgi:hypothetical protein
MPKNYYDPRNLARMERGSRKRAQDQLRFLNQQEKRREKEIQDAETAEYAQLVEMTNQINVGLAQGFAGVAKTAIKAGSALEDIAKVWGCDRLGNRR